MTYPEGKQQPSGGVTSGKVTKLALPEKIV